MGVDTYGGPVARGSGACTSGRGAPRVRVSMLFVRCAVFSLCVVCVQIKATPGVVRCMGHGSCVNLDPGLLSHSFRAVRHSIFIHFLFQHH